MVKRSTYPIPDGYRMLAPEERVQAGDMAWADLTGRFVTIQGGYAGETARRFTCPIRKDDNYLLERIEKHAK